MNRIVLFFLLLCPVAGFSQNFIGKTKTQVKKELQQQLSKHSDLAIKLTDSDSSIVYSYKDDKVNPVDFIYGFDKNGKCRSEKVVAGCDSCFKKYLGALLAQKKYEWKKINENQYVSKYADKMMIELPGDSRNFTYSILQTDWSKEMYQLLTGN